MKSTGRITYRYEVEGHEVCITRVHTGTAYARNGNVGNPTEYFAWEACLDGEYQGRWQQRAMAYEEVRAQILGIPYFDPYAYAGGPKHLAQAKNVRPYTLVQDEMKANYRGQVKA